MIGDGRHPRELYGRASVKAWAARLRGFAICGALVFVHDLSSMSIAAWGGGAAFID